MNNSEIPLRVHFVGCGGIGMSGLAQHLHGLGHIVSGSDRIANDRTDALAAMGIQIHIGHSAENIANAQLVVRTSAVSPDNEEIVAANARGIPTMLREQLLGIIFDSFDTRIAVCGTHGKTTVTAMLHEALSAAGVDHAAFIGGVYRGNNYFAGKGAVVAEACEYNRSFLYLHPTHCVCLNAEFDHPDCYKNTEDVRNSFARFFANTEPNGCVVLPSELKSCFAHRNRLLYDKEFVAHNVTVSDGKPSFEAISAEGQCYRVNLNVVGVHNVDNALAVFGTVKALRLPLSAAVCGLETFAGVERRWTPLHVDGISATVLDYAHHPTEIACSVAAAKSIAKGRVLCLFQPHTYTRTKAFWTEFAECFRKADAVAYLPIYSAREKPIVGVNSYLLAQSAAERGINACFLPDFASAKQWIFGNAAPDDVLLILGAGNINLIASEL